MKVLIDTNIIIDGLQSRKGFLEDSGLVMLRSYEYNGFITASSMTDIFYLMNRFYHNKKKARDGLAELTKIFAIIDTTASDCLAALRSDISDYEDAVMYETVRREKIDVIVTRNKKDFKNTTIKVYTPVEFLREL
ncbi:PIN domain-containing protein [Candidatus Saccharibacteria bacterium]|nr:PIN domain-containing protein [Candidatus Saccharibacteria bacterium]MBQ3476013.1 PIN domain-containing protein [Candidatus Saccharibacteria bacterium]